MPELLKHVLAFKTNDCRGVLSVQGLTRLTKSHLRCQAAAPVCPFCKNHRDLFSADSGCGILVGMVWKWTITHTNLKALSAGSLVPGERLRLCSHMWLNPWCFSKARLKCGCQMGLQCFSFQLSRRSPLRRNLSRLFLWLCLLPVLERLSLPG